VDKAVHPFVGPAGRILEQARMAAGIDHATVSTTNAVKHFKYRKAGGEGFTSGPPPMR
jgi:uracil-DNA glycosylase